MNHPLLLALSFLVAALAGCTGEDKNAVDLYDNSFQPTRLDATAGETLTFANEGQNQHTVTIHRAGDATNALQKDDTLDPGQTTTFTLAASGVYHVYCRFHSGGANADFAASATNMAMQVTVTA